MFFIWGRGLSQGGLVEDTQTCHVTQRSQRKQDLINSTVIPSSHESINIQ